MGKFNSDWIERDVHYRLKEGTGTSTGNPPHYEQYERPVIVCLCGSTRFPDAFINASKEETLAGKIVLSVGNFGHLHQSIMTDDGCMGPQETIVWKLIPSSGDSISAEQKIMLDQLHKQKINLADEILVLNVGGYIGGSTRSEVKHAIAKCKTIRWLEPDNIPEEFK